MKTKYNINYDNKASVIIEVDDEIMTEEALAEINNFWSNHENRLDAAEGNILRAVLKLLTATILVTQVEQGVNKAGMIRMFDWNGRNGGIEGWPCMDGSQGFEIIDVDDFEFDAFDMTILSLE